MNSIHEIIEFIKEEYRPYRDQDCLDYGLSDGKTMWELGRKQGYRDILHALLDFLNPPALDSDVLSTEDRIPADLYGRTGTPSA